MPTPLTEAQSNAIAAALRSGNKIEAVKLHREATGLGLKESKDAVEAIQAQAGLGGKAPEGFPAKAGKGCLGVVALLLAAGAAGTGWWLTRA